MSFPLHHWNNPRASIATRFQNNDFAYITRGANIALYILDQFNITPSEAKNMTVLDYGCGTGRASFFLSKIFGKSVGYDPNTYCIAEGIKENVKCDFPHVPNLLLTSDLKQVPVCDIAFSTNVIEHLENTEARIMVDTLKEKNKGRTLLWYSPKLNGCLSDYMAPDEWALRLERADNARIQIDFFDFKLGNPSQQ